MGNARRRQGGRPRAIQRQGARLAVFRASLALTVWFFAPSLSRAAEPWFDRPEKEAQTPFRVDAHTDGSPATIQMSPDLRQWTDVVELPAAESPIPFVDEASLSWNRRFYRVIRRTAGPESLRANVNTAFVPNEGFNTVQAASDDRFLLIVWQGSELVLWEEQTSGTWHRQSVCDCGGAYAGRTFDGHRFQPLAQLLLDSTDQPHVFVLRESIIQHFRRTAGSEWTTEPPIAVPGSKPPTLFAADVGPGDVFHFAVAAPSQPPVIRYGSNRTGEWQWTIAATLREDPRGFLRQSYAPRFFSLAADSSNAAHLTFSPAFRETWGERGAEVHSELAYASNRFLDFWIVETVMVPDDASGDAALGASLAIGPNDQPAIVSWYNERAATGSSQWSQLLIHRKSVAGLWTRSTVARYPDGYVAGDGIKGTGFAPYLRFNSSGRPHVIFSDHASQHFEASGQNEFAGQLRHAVFRDGQWTVDTLYPQSNPLRRQLIYPAFALTSERVGFLALDWSTRWNHEVWPREVASEYRFVWLEQTRPKP